LQADRTIKKYLIVQTEGSREVKREVDHYNLDAIISVGYRVNSQQATKFRIWATGVLRQYIADGYVIDEQRLRSDPPCLLVCNWNLNWLKALSTTQSGLIFILKRSSPVFYIHALVAYQGRKGR